jgi:hypothetical protein
MPASLQSVVLGLIPLQIILVVALGLTVTRLPRADSATRDRLVSLFLIGIAAQSFHFIEEFVTGFHCRWPELLGLSPWSAEFFVSFNVSWIAVWALSAAGLRAGIRAALFPTWFFAIGMTVNLVGHPLLALNAGGYFPGLWTSPVVGVIGVTLLGRLAGYTTRGHLDPIGVVPSDS